MCLCAALKGTLRQKCTAIRYRYVGLIAYFCHEVLSKHFREGSLMFLLLIFLLVSNHCDTLLCRKLFFFGRIGTKASESRPFQKKHWQMNCAFNCPTVAFFIDLDITLLMWELVLLCLGASVWMFNSVSIAQYMIVVFLLVSIAQCMIAIYLSYQFKINSLKQCFGFSGRDSTNSFSGRILIKSIHESVNQSMI